MNAGFASLAKWILGILYFCLALFPLLFLPTALQVGLLVLLFGLSAWNYLSADQTASEEQDLRPLTPWDLAGDPLFASHLDTAAESIGLTSPIWAVEESDEVYRYSVSGRRGLVVFSTGLLHQLPPAEILAVAGHELQHLKSRDAVPAVLGASWLALLGQISAAFRRVSQPMAGGQSGLWLVTMLAGVAAFLLDMLVLVVGAVAEFYLASRTAYEEHLADLAGARLTTGGTMASALTRLEEIAGNPSFNAPRWSPEWITWRMNAKRPPLTSRLAFLQGAIERGEIDA